MVARSEGQAEAERGSWLFPSALQAPVCSLALVMQPVAERHGALSITVNHALWLWRGRGFNTHLMI